jgi:hypothetical protein
MKAPKIYSICLRTNFANLETLRGTVGRVKVITTSLRYLLHKSRVKFFKQNIIILWRTHNATININRV